ncbi:MAG TPA: hypothetical protein VE888_19340 [Streptosporangiaceae bacterium]|nr:hypothetical protein [Streptosporangiaceae bacterium]
MTGRVRGVFDDLLGQAAWPPPRDWGRPLVTFPEPGAWDVPTRLWHWDNPCDLHLDHPRALFVVSFIGPVAPYGGGTLILSGSPRLLIQQERQLPVSQRRGSIATLRDRFHRSHPWLMALTGQAPSPADRIAAFMDRETTVEGVPLRVVELTGEPGDMVFCHPVVVHCVAPNRGTRPRFRRTKTAVLTHEGRGLRNRTATAALLGRALDLAADLVRDLVDLLLGLDQAGLGLRRPLGGPALAPRRLPAGPSGVLRSPEQAHDPVLSIARWAARWQPEGGYPPDTYLCHPWGRGSG